MLRGSGSEQQAVGPPADGPPGEAGTSEPWWPAVAAAPEAPNPVAHGAVREPEPTRDPTAAQPPRGLGQGQADHLDRVDPAGQAGRGQQDVRAPAPDAPAASGPHSQDAVQLPDDPGTGPPPAPKPSPARAGQLPPVQPLHHLSRRPDDHPHDTTSPDCSRPHRLGRMGDTFLSDGCRRMRQPAEAQDPPNGCRPWTRSGRRLPARGSDLRPGRYGRGRVR